MYVYKIINPTESSEKKNQPLYYPLSKPNPFSQYFKH